MTSVWWGSDLNCSSDDNELHDIGSYHCWWCSQWKHSLCQVEGSILLTDVVVFLSYVLSVCVYLCCVTGLTVSQVYSMSCWIHFNNLIGHLLVFIISQWLSGLSSCVTGQTVCHVYSVSCWIHFNSLVGHLLVFIVSQW